MTNLAQTAWFGPVMMVVFLLQLAAMVYVIIQCIRDRRAESKQIDQLARERDEMVLFIRTMYWWVGSIEPMELRRRARSEIDAMIKKIESGELE